MRRARDAAIRPTARSASRRRRSGTKTAGIVIGIVVGGLVHRRDHRDPGRDRHPEPPHRACSARGRSGHGGHADDRRRASKRTPRTRTRIRTATSIAELTPALHAEVHEDAARASTAGARRCVTSAGPTARVSTTRSPAPARTRCSSTSRCRSTRRTRRRRISTATSCSSNGKFVQYPGRSRRAQ